MLKLNFKCFVNQITEFEKKSDKLQLQKLIVTVPARRDDFGDTKGKDQSFEVVFFNEKIKCLKGIDEALKNSVDKLTGSPNLKAEITGYLNGNDRLDEESNKVFYNMFISGSDVKILS